MELRDYQAAMLNEARAHMRSGTRRILMQLPTGGGKTVMAASMLDGAADREMRSWFAVHRRELIEQTSRTFREVGIAHGFIASGMPANGIYAVQLAGVQTLINRLDTIKEPKLIVWDEAHHATATIWSTIMARYPDAYHIGLSATPQRLDGRGLRGHFDVMVKGPSVAELIRRGFLCQYTYFAPGKPDLLGVPTRAGDFNRGELGDVMDRPKLIGDVVEHYHRLAAGKQGIVFAVSRDHSRHIADAFIGNGVRAAHIDGSMTERERGRIVDAFRAGDLEIMVNVDLFGEGFDVPGLVYCGLARPTKSLALYLQQVGRALRVMEGKGRAIIADHAANIFAHGWPDDERDWTLDGRKKRGGRAANDDAMPIRQCTECFRVSPSRVSVCPGCGFEFVAQGRAPETGDGELFALDRLSDREAAKKAATAERKAEERACQDIADFIRLGTERGYANPAGWARHQVQFRKGYAQKFRRRA